MFCFGEQFGSNRKLRAIKWCLAAGQREHDLNYNTGNFEKTNSAISSLWSSAKLEVEHPKSPQRDVESGEKSHCWVKFFSGNQQIQEAEHKFLGESAPHAGFYPQLPPLGSQDPAELLFQANNSQCQRALEAWSCQASLRGGSRIPSSEVSAPAAPLNTCPVLPTAAEVDFSGINCLNPSAVLKSTGAWEEDLLEQVISSAKHVIFKLPWFFVIENAKKNLIQLLMDFKLRGKFSLCRKAHLNFSTFTIQPLFCYMEGNSLSSTQMVQSISLLGKGLKGIFKLQRSQSLNLSNKNLKGKQYYT